MWPTALIIQGILCCFFGEGHEESHLYGKIKSILVVCMAFLNVNLRHENDSTARPKRWHR